MSTVKIALLVSVVGFCTMVFTIFAVTFDHAKVFEKQVAFSNAERQLLQIVVNASRHYWSGDTLNTNIYIYYEDYKLDTSVYTYSYNADHLAVIATAKDSSLVPVGKEKIAYFISSGNPVRYKYDWL